MSTSFPRKKIRIALFEGIHQRANTLFEDAGYSVEAFSRAIDVQKDSSLLSEAHIIGIRSKSEVNEELLASASKLLSIGCFCIGTDQVALGAAAGSGVPVFNAPFSNTRSVAELALAEIIMLSRKASFRSRQMHAGVWEKSASGSHEVRGKTLGIVGYGRIGQQLGLLAEALGIRVLYTDVEKKLPLGNAKESPLKELLKMADYVSLHVPDTDVTRMLIGEKELTLMKPGSVLLNLSRGKVVDLDALSAAIREKRISGAALDVYPSEPATREASFDSPMRELPNVILTPHIGGSTEEAQENIGAEVVTSLLGFLEAGDTTGAVNFPQVSLPKRDQADRVLYIHKNEPGALRDVNDLVASLSLNIQAQQLQTKEEIGYLVMDVESGLSRKVKEKLEALSAHVRSRLLF